MAGEDCIVWVSLGDHAGNTKFVRRTMGSLTRRICAHRYLGGLAACGGGYLNTYSTALNIILGLFLM